jgi:hypothetical protein
MHPSQALSFELPRLRAFRSGAQRDRSPKPPVAAGNENDFATKFHEASLTHLNAAARQSLGRLCCVYSRENRVHSYEPADSSSALIVSISSRGGAMTDHVYKTIHITGTSKQGVEEAIKGAVAKAASSVHNLRWFKVTEVRGEISGAAVEYWQVSIEVGFTLD